MKLYFLFRPCKKRSAYEMVIRGEVDRKILIEKICKEFGGKIRADTNFLTVIDIGKGRISISRDNKILIRDIKEENEAKKIADRVMRAVLRTE